MSDLNPITKQIIASAIRVHSRYGPGLLESVYAPCLAQELLLAGLNVELEKPVALTHEGLQIPRAYVLDVLVEEQVVGLIINFNVIKLVHGLTRVANRYVD